MNLFLRLSFRNVFRNRVRTAIALLAIATGCSALILNGGIVVNIFRELRDDAIYGRYGHLQIYKKGYADNHLRDPGRYLLSAEECEQIFKLAHSNPRIVHVTRRREFSGLIANKGNYIPFMGVGVEPENDSKFSRHDTLKEGKPLSSDETYTALAGLGLAKKLNGKPGDTLSIMTTTESGGLNAIHVRLQGVFEGGMKEFDDWTLKMPLPALDQLLGENQTEKIAMLVSRTEDADAVRAELENTFQQERMDVEIHSWRELALFHNQVVSLFGRELGIIHLIVGTMVVLGIGNVLAMAIVERRTELAAVRAIGISSRSVICLLMTESLVTGVIGVIAGVALGVGIARIVNAFGIPYPSPPGSTRPFQGGADIVPGIVVEAAWASLVATLVGAVFPVYRAVRRPIASLLRHG
jgi:putative ABC transport system permease protein